MLVLLAGCSSATASPAPAAASPASHDAVRFYLSVGDSLAFGLQQARATRETREGDWSPASFPGYSSRVAAALARRHPGLVSENLGCPGETTLTYLHGHCPFLAQHLALHTHYSGPQQQAALRFLRSQHGRPGLVTVSVGANDVGPAVVSCGLQQVGGGSLTGGRCRLSVLRAVLAGLDRRLGRILHRLRAADPAATVVLLEPYNPYAEYAPGTDRWMRVLVPALASVARTAGVRPVTAFAAFNRTPGEKARLCRWTGICQLPPDIHPTDAGYAELARLLLRAA